MASSIYVNLPVGASSSPFTDSTGIIKGSTDATKILAIEVDGFTTATTRTFTPPDANLTITTAAGTVLDDTTVSAMVDTLGGASALGTGGLVRGTAPTFTTSLQIGSAGVLLSDDGDGALTILSKGNGSGGLEDLTINLDDVSNEAGITSSTGLSTIRFTAASPTLAVRATGTSVYTELDLGNTVSATAGNIFVNGSAQTTFGGASSLNFNTDQSAPINFIPGNGLVQISNGAANEELQVFALRTDASNYHYGSFAMSDTALTISTQTLGTGVDNLGISLTMSGTGVFTLGGNSEDFVSTFTSNTLTYTSSTGVDLVNFSGMSVQGGFKAADGSAGVSAGPYTTLTSITVKNGIITAITGA